MQLSVHNSCCSRSLSDTLETRLERKNCKNGIVRLKRRKAVVGMEEDRRLGFSTELKIQFLCQVAFYILLQCKFLKFYSEGLGLAKPVCPIPYMCVCFEIY